MKIEADLYEDWINILKQELVQLGYDVANLTGERVAIAYYNALHRRILPAPRQVVRANGFTCPPNRLAAIQIIEAKAESGQDLNPHLSKTLTKRDYNDGMLNDWGIHHLHLGTTNNMSGYVNRTGPLMFVMVTATHFYEIGLKKHGDWLDRDVVQAIHDNWPEAVERFKIRGITDMTSNPTSEHIGVLRRKNVNTFLTMLDGTVYAPTGGGYATDGTSMKVVMQVHQIAQLMRDFRKRLMEHSDKLVADLKESGIRVPDVLRFRLRCYGNDFYAECTDSTITLPERVLWLARSKVQN